MRFLDTAGIRFRMHERIATADGTLLSTDLYLPPEAGRYPVLLFRTPADNNRMARAVGTVDMGQSPADRWKALAAQGFIVAAADVRGRGDSDGTFTPFVNEGADGRATVEWLRTHPECNGKVGAFGSGYAAFCAWAALAEGAAIDAIVSISPFGAVGNGLVHRGGAVRLDWLFWMHLIGGRSLQPAALPPWPKIHRHWPLATLDTALGREDIAWRDWMSHPDPSDAYWAPLALADKLPQRPVPALHITGWWDAHLPGARYYYDAAARASAPQSLIVGPWDAVTVRHPRSVVGGVDFGPRSLIDPDETLAQYFGATLRGEANAFAKPVTRLFVTGRNEWIESNGWPAAKATRTLRLSSTNGANTRRGDGVLGAESAGHDEVSHNPAMPVDFQPNFLSFASGTLTFEQAHITARDEALVYTTKPLTKTLTVFGRPKVTLTITVNAPDADLFVLLSDEFPLGARDLHLSHAAVRLATLKAFHPGKPVAVTLELDPLAHDFLPGHSIRLTVTPSLFPLYARNPQAADYANATEPTLATIALRHGVESVLHLPEAE